MDARPVARRCRRDAVRLGIVGIVALVQAFASPVVDASSTAANAWRAAIGGGGSNGAATVRQLAADTGSIPQPGRTKAIDGAASPDP